MIIHTVYDIGFDHDKDPPDTPRVVNGLNLYSILRVLSRSLSRIPSQIELRGSSFGSRLTTWATDMCTPARAYGIGTPR
jgi:hypothetical protein